MDLASPSTHVPSFLVSVSAFWNGNPNSTESPQLVFVNEKYCVPSVKEKKKRVLQPLSHHVIAIPVVSPEGTQNEKTQDTGPR